MPPSEGRLLVTLRARPGGRLDELRGDAPDPPLPSPLPPPPGPTRWIWGGEPTLRRDLPDIVAALGRAGPVGLRTDGAVLARPEALARLAAAGLDALRVPIHAADAAVHDVLAGGPGRLAAAVRALRLARGAGLHIEVECTVTAPSLDRLPGVVELAARLGARTLHVRRLRARGAAREGYRGWAPRLALARPWLRAARRRAEALGLHWQEWGWPACYGTAGGPRPTAAWAALPGLDPPPPDLPGPGCSTCPGPPACLGAPPDLLAAFGWSEFERPLAGEPRAPGSPRALRTAILAPSPLACPTCADPPVAAPEPTRAARLRLVRAAARRPERLRIVSAGGLHHPAAPELLREVVRVARVEIAGDLAPLAEWPDRDLLRLRRLAAASAALLGPTPSEHDAHAGLPGHHAATREALTALCGLGVPVTAHAVLHAPDVDRWAHAWEDLPARPAFRLAPAGGRLAELAARARHLPAPLAAALDPLLPPCLRADPAPLPEPQAPGAAWGVYDADRAAPSGLDRLGVFVPCPLRGACAASASCPGLPRGWDPEGIRPVSPGSP